jgi:hypothetical protein
MSALHLLVVLSDYTLMAQFLEFKSIWKMGPLEMGLKEAKGRNPCDLAIENGNQSMLDILIKNGGHPSYEIS